MRIRITIEYDTLDTLDHEWKAWYDGEISLRDFDNPNLDHGEVAIKIEKIKKTEV